MPLSLGEEIAGAQIQQGTDPTPPAPDFRAVFDAVFRTENTLGSFASQFSQATSERLFERSPVAAQDRDQELKKQQIDRELEDRETLARGGLNSFVATFAAGAAAARPFVAQEKLKSVFGSDMADDRALAVLRQASPMLRGAVEEENGHWVLVVLIDSGNTPARLFG